MPGYGKFHRLLDQNYFWNCPVTSHGARRAIHIYGDDIAAFKGKTTRQRPPPIHHQQFYDIPPAIKDLHSDVMLNMDYMFVQNIAMLISISSKYQFRTNMTFSQGFKSYSKCIRRVGYASHRSMLITSSSAFEMQFAPFTSMLWQSMNMSAR